MAHAPSAPQQRTFRAPTLPSGPPHKQRTFGERPSFTDPTQAPELPPPQQNPFEAIPQEMRAKIEADIRRIFTPDDISTLSDIERTNIVIEIWKNNTKRKNDPFTDQEIRDMATNPPARLGPVPGQDI
jgi:hypothetical protein